MTRWAMAILVPMLLLAAEAASAQDPEVRVAPIVEPREAVRGETILYAIDVRVLFQGDVEPDAPTPPELAESEDFRARFEQTVDRGRSERLEIVGGRRSRTVERHWQLVYSIDALRDGAITIPGPAFEYLGATRSVPAIGLEVLAEAPGNALARLRVTAEPARPYVNQPVTLRFEIEADKPVNPNVPPTLEIPWAFSLNGVAGAAPELGWTEGRGIIARVNGDRFDLKRERGRTESPFETLVFERRVFPIAPGRIELEPGRAQFEIATRVGRRDLLGTRILESKKAVLVGEPLAIEVRDAPRSGRPAGFGGVVGDFEVDLGYGKTEIRAGDGVTLTLQIRGPGALEAVEPPELRGFEDFDVYPPERNVVALDDGRRELQIVWLLVPRRDREVTEMPRFEFSWFRPATETFEAAVAEATPLTLRGEVTAEEGVYVGPGAAREARRLLGLGEGVRPIKSRAEAFESAPPRPAAPLVLALLLLPLASWLLTGFLARRRRALGEDPSEARRRRASKAAAARLDEARSLLGAPRGFHAGLARTLTGLVADKLDVPPGRVTAATAPAILAEGGAPAETAARFSRLLAELEAREFGGGDSDPAARRRDLEAAEALIATLDRELRR